MLSLGKILPQDKAGHLAGGVILGLAGSSIAYGLGLPIPNLWGFTFGTMIGIAKEIYDLSHRDKHTPEFLDALATATGSAFCFVLPW